MSSTMAPSFTSLAFEDRPPPDWAAVTVEALPAGAPSDPTFWAEQIFSRAHLPTDVHVLMAARQLLVRLIGIEPSGPEVFTVDGLRGQEALIVEHERHLDFRCGVGVDVDAGLLRVTTAVWLHGWRGRVYFGPVSIAHDPICRAMMRAAVRRVAATSQASTSGATMAG